MFKVCRTCLCKIYDLNYFTLTSNTVTTVIKSQLALCVPEMVVDMVIEPVICSSCVTSLHAAFNFKYQCLQTEEQIRAYLKKHNSFINNFDLTNMFSNDIECTDVAISSESMSTDLDKITSDIPSLFNNSPRNDKKTCESSNEDNEITTLEMVDELEENQIEFNTVFDETAITEIDVRTEYSHNDIIPETVEPTLNCNLDQWANFEKDYLNVYDLENLNKLVCNLKKRPKRKTPVSRKARKKASISVFF
ncbi:hypothetical protein ILUMI_26820 [Ignelater luminosus]|uniref:ZAD domain-containing protein n=1 Tax=Ignelater luminosus TaxID=2038154 RepID=A0A8K0C3G7_IGNLU|nr:hypothetical protein ILUMI_26820 [Ignelater luminosus]